MDVELNNLTEPERDVIMAVLKRDEQLRQKEMDRIKNLRTDVKRIRLKGVIRDGHDTEKTCARCREKFGWLFNKGSLCPKCQHKVCDKCKMPIDGAGWMCILCFKQRELEAQTNKWFYSQFRRSKRSRKSHGHAVVTGTDIVRSSLRKVNRQASGSGSESGQLSISNEIRKALSNNNTSSKIPRHFRNGVDPDADSSDTQSTGTSQSKPKKTPIGKSAVLSDISVPNDSDTNMLFDLIRPSAAKTKSQENNHTVQVRKVVSRYYSNSGSSSDSEPASPRTLQTESAFDYSDSIRSSIRSSTSIVSSEGRMTLVTESCVSDIDTLSVMSEIPPLETPLMIPNKTPPVNNAAQSVKTNTKSLTPKDVFHLNFHSKDSQSSQKTKSKSESPKDEATPTVVHKLVTSKPIDSLSSESDEEFTTEQITKVKFRRVSRKNASSKCPTPEDQPSTTVDSKSQELTKTKLAGPGQNGSSNNTTKGLQDQRRFKHFERPITPSPPPRWVNHSPVISLDSKSSSSRSSPYIIIDDLQPGELKNGSSGSDSETDESKGSKGVWTDDDPIRSKVGVLLARYGRLDGTELSYIGPSSKETKPVKDLVKHNTSEKLMLFSKDEKVQIGEDYVVIDTMDSTHDTSETSIEPHSGSEEARTLSDIENSFDELEWDADIIMNINQENIGDDSDAALLSELRATIAANMANTDVNCSSPTPQYSAKCVDQSINRLTADIIGEADMLDDEDDDAIPYEFQSFQRTNNDNATNVGRYPRMFALQDDDQYSDTLSIITELTEPDECYRSMHSSRSSTPKGSQSSDVSRSSTPGLRSSTSTPSTIEEIEPGILDKQKKYQTSTQKMDCIPHQMNQREHNRQLQQTTEKYSEESDSSCQSLSHISECSATESGQESLPVDQIKSDQTTKSLYSPRRDSFDVLAESSAYVAALDFTDVYEANKEYAQELEDEEMDLPLASSLKPVIRPEKPKRNIDIKSELIKTKGLETPIKKGIIVSKQQDSDDQKRASLQTKSRQKILAPREDIGEFYKNIRSKLSHVDQPDDELKLKKRKMSDTIVDSSHVAAINRLTELFDKDPAYMKAGSRKSWSKLEEEEASLQLSSSESQKVHKDETIKPELLKEKEHVISNGKIPDESQNTTVKTDYTEISRTESVEVLFLEEDVSQSSSHHIEENVGLLQASKIDEKAGVDVRTTDHKETDTTEYVVDDGRESVHEDNDVTDNITEHNEDAESDQATASDNNVPSSVDTTEVIDESKALDKHDNVTEVKPETPPVREAEEDTNTTKHEDESPETNKTSAEQIDQELDDNMDITLDASMDSPIVHKITTPFKGSGNLQSNFSASRESVTSYYSDAGDGNYGNVAISGEILLALDYNYKTSCLEITIKQCKDLAAADKKKNRSDPYVKTYLLPDKTKNSKRKTKVKKHTVSPIYEEVLKYQISKSELEMRTIWVSVWNNGILGRNDFLGEVSIPLNFYGFEDNSARWYRLRDKESSNRKSKSMSPKSILSLNDSHGDDTYFHQSSSNIKQKSKSVSFLGDIKSPAISKFKSEEQLGTAASSISLITYKGDLILSLKFVTSDSAGGKKRIKGIGMSRGELHVLVKEARNLTAVRSNGTSDPFCKAYLLPQKSRSLKQKTPVLKKNVNPQWNHTFVFEDISLDDLRERSLELTIWDHDRFTSNEFLGGLRLNNGSGKCAEKEVDWMDARGEELNIWQKMLDCPNSWSEGSLMLRANMSQRY